MTAGKPLDSGGQWYVDAVTERTDFSNPGRLVEGKDVSFVTGYGVRGTVFVSNATFNPATVAAMVAPEAAKLDAVFNLTHESA